MRSDVVQDRIRTAEIRESCVSRKRRKKGREEMEEMPGKRREKKAVDTDVRTQFPDRHDGRFRPVRSMAIIPTSRANGADRYGRFSSFAWSVRSVCSGRSHETRDTHTHTHIYTGAWLGTVPSLDEANELEKERYLPRLGKFVSIRGINSSPNEFNVVDVRGGKEKGRRKERKLTVGLLRGESRE